MTSPTQANPIYGLRRVSDMLRSSTDLTQVRRGMRLLHLDQIDGTDHLGRAVSGAAETITDERMGLLLGAIRALRANADITTYPIGNGPKRWRVGVLGGDQMGHGDTEIGALVAACLDALEVPL